MIKWKQHNQTKLNLIIKNNKPIWLKVEKATTFLRSFSLIAVIPATSIVIILKYNRVPFTHQSSSNALNLIRIKTPAVTNVLLWTREEIGVGAAIAAGNHLEKGNWALLVILIKTTNKETKIKVSDNLILFLVNINPVSKTNNTPSPTRLLKKVIKLLFKDFQFW